MTVVTKNGYVHVVRGRKYSQRGRNTFLVKYLDDKKEVSNVGITISGMILRLPKEMLGKRVQLRVEEKGE